jgi:Amt family ammonium transporter
MAQAITLSHDELGEMLNKLVDEKMAGHRALTLSDTEASITGALDVFYLLYAGALVFMMQAGFAMLCAGCLREKNIKNIMLKNVLDACVGALGFWAVGYGLAYGTKCGVAENCDKDWYLIGDDLFFLGGGWDEGDYHSWFFQFAFAATAATIVSGAVAERCQMTAYALYSAVLTAFVYPVVVHHVWSSEGYFSAFRNNPLFGVGVVDFAGCGVVHMVGGISAFVGAAVLGPRSGRFDPLTGQIADEMPGHNSSLVVLGTFILWFGWYGFNPGSTLGIYTYENIAAKTAVTTTVAAAAGCVTNLILHYVLSGLKVLSLEEACNGALAGLVGITSACPVVDPWAAIAIGAIACFAYTFGCKLCLLLKIDDPVNASGVHFFAGMWGLIAPAIFASERNMVNAYGPAMKGLVYGGGITMLKAQAFGLGAIVAWVVATMLPFFIILKCCGVFRVSADVEEAGMDASEHGGGAYHVGGK